MYSRAFGDNLFNYMGISSLVYTYCITAGPKFKTHTHATHISAHQRIFVRDNIIYYLYIYIKPFLHKPCSFSHHCGQFDNALGMIFFRQ